ncbi:MAG: FAD-binding oxidoreductase [Pseudomonadota bacterium]
MMLSGWGRFPTIYAPVEAPRDEATLAAAIAKGGVIARGNGRAYGDSAISRRGTIDMRRFNRMISFDQEAGILIAEAGVLLADVISSFLPRGWFPLVSPGTKFVTLGGMIAADVHGKNHHAHGSMRAAVLWLDLMGPDGQIRRCSAQENADLFEWSFGTMGLTGIILRAAIRLTPVETGWITQTMHPAENLDQAMTLFEENADATYSVAWIDCLSTGAAQGRSLVMLGEHATSSDLSFRERDDVFASVQKKKKRLPFEAPAFAMSPPVVKAFNAAYFWNGRRKQGPSLVDWDTYFYPLDAILDWNKAYGRKGFLQFQCALPLEASKAGLTELLAAISGAGAGSFLAVLKRLGAQSSRYSFPMLGYTLALDFPANAKNLNLLQRLDRITISHGGRFYLAKDSRMSAETLRDSDPRTADFLTQRHLSKAAGAFQSSQSERLDL